VCDFEDELYGFPSCAVPTSCTGSPKEKCAITTGFWRNFWRTRCATGYGGISNIDATSGRQGYRGSEGNYLVAKRLGACNKVRVEFEVKFDYDRDFSREHDGGVGGHRCAGGTHFLSFRSDCRHNCSGCNLLNYTRVELDQPSTRGFRTYIKQDRREAGAYQDGTSFEGFSLDTYFPSDLGMRPGKKLRCIWTVQIIRGAGDPDLRTVHSHIKYVSVDGVPLTPGTEAQAFITMNSTHVALHFFHLGNFDNDIDCIGPNNPPNQGCSASLPPEGCHPPYPIPPIGAGPTHYRMVLEDLTDPATVPDYGMVLNFSNGPDPNFIIYDAPPEAS
jgi:hypothetical protein